MAILYYYADSVCVIGDIHKQAAITEIGVCKDSQDCRATRGGW